MARQRFWKGFAIGAGVGAGAFATTYFLLRSMVRGKRRLVRLEKSIQVGRPVPEVFAAWSDLKQLARFSDCIQEVRQQGSRSHWRVNVNGRAVEWDAQVEQYIPNQAIGWKSVSGPKHTGRITFSPIGSDTLIQVTMNYAPPVAVRAFSAPLADPLEGYMERVLRDFKAAIEGKGQEGRKPAVRGNVESLGPGPRMTQTEALRATGTSDVTPESESRFGGKVNPVDYTRPPEAKS